MILLVIPPRVLISRRIKLFAFSHFFNTGLGPAITRPQVHRVGIHEREVHERWIFFTRNESCEFGISRFIPSDARAFTSPLKITEKCRVGSRLAVDPVQRKFPLACRNDLEANARISVLEFIYTRNVKAEACVSQISQSVFGAKFM